jgi:hypothetical protein
LIGLDDELLPFFEQTGAFGIADLDRAFRNFHGQELYALLCVGGDAVHQVHRELRAQGGYIAVGRCDDELALSLSHAYVNPAGDVLEASLAGAAHANLCAFGQLDRGTVG